MKKKSLPFIGQSLVASLAFAALTFAGLVHAAPGDLDPAFNGTGYQLQPPSPSSSYVLQRVIVQSDGKILGSGAALGGVLGLIRLNADGSLDTGFGSAGIITLASFAQATAIVRTAAPRIIVATSSLAPQILQFTDNGQPDPAFGISGVASGPSPGFTGGAFTSIGVQSDGKIVVGGWGYVAPTYVYSMIVARFNANGTFDTTFGTGGFARTAPSALGSTLSDLAVLPDDSIAVVGRLNGAPGLLHLSPQGADIGEYGLPGMSSTGHMVRDADGSFLIAGEGVLNGQIHMMALRLSPSFVPVSTMQVAIGDFSEGLGVGVQPNGRIIVAGLRQVGVEDQGALACFNADGTLDTAYGTNGVAQPTFGTGATSFYDVAVDLNGRAIAGGPHISFNGNNQWVIAAVEGDLASAPPVAANDAYSVDENTTLNVAAPGVLANDSDANADPLTAVLVQGPAHGSLALNANGSFTYAPAAYYFGTDTFRYSANDGASNSNVATVTITVSHVNQAPNAVADSYATDQNVALVVAAPGVLANDTDVDGDTLTASIVAGPAHGSLALNAGGGFTYTPSAGYHGPDAFTYRAADPSGLASQAPVSITVNAVKTSPVVSLAAPASAAYGTQFTVVATTQASTQATITVDAASSAVCSISGPTVTMLSGAGSCVLDASWPADVNYLAASAQSTTAALRAPSATQVAATDALYDGAAHGATAAATGYNLEVVLAVTYAGAGATSYGPTADAPVNAGSYVASAAYAGDANHLGSVGSAPFVIAPAAAQIEYTGLDAISTLSGSSTTGNVLSSATVSVAAGDIGTATITFTNDEHPAGIPGCTQLAVRPLDAHAATALCEWTATVGAGGTLHTHVAATLGGNYAAAASGLLLAVAQPKKGSAVTGSGQLALAAATGAFAGSSAQATPDAGFTRGSTNALNGRFKATITRGTTVYAFDATELRALATEPATGRAGMTGVAAGSTWDTASPGLVTPLGEGFRFQLRAFDAGAPGVGRDTVELTVWDSTGLLVLSTHWSGLHTAPETLTGGNIGVK